MNEINEIHKVIKDNPILKHEKLLELITYYQNQNNPKQERLKAREKIILSNIRYVKKIVGMYIKPQFAFNEIEQEGYIGLMKAIEKFNPKLGFHFSTYATHRIYQKITIFMYNNNGLVRIPVNKHEEIIKLKYAFVKLKIKLERKPTNKELSQHLGISIKQIDKLKKIYFNDDYLEIIENPDYNNPDKLSNTTILKDDLPEVIDEIIIKDYRKQIDNILNNSCNEREKLLFTKYYLEEGNTLESIGKIVGITKERARQILKVTYGKVQNKMIK